MPERMRNNYRILHKWLPKGFVLGATLIFLTAGFGTSCKGKDETPAEPAVSLESPHPAHARVTENALSAVTFATAIERVAEKTIPAVVHIEVTERQEIVNPLLPFENNPFFHYFFNFPKIPRKFQRVLKGLGTGMIIDTDGHILTNNHVAGGATKIDVLLANGKKYPADLVGADPKTDLAVIKIPGDKSLPHVTFGDSDAVKVGAWVVAIGHPRGLDQTVTQGIISAKHRTGIMDPSSYQDFLQTDAAINPGNSGGPLLNLQGEVIGVNAAIVSQSGGFEGIGFAIPSNMAIHIANELIAKGKVERGWLGVSVQDLTPELAEKFGIDKPRGALIADVIKGSPADTAGLKRGDIIVTFAGKEIRDAGALRNEVAASPIGRSTEITVWRDGSRLVLAVTLGDLKEQTRILSRSIKERLGVEVRTLTKREAENYGIKPGRGVLIQWVDPTGPLGQAGFEVGDILLKINGQTIKDVNCLARFLGTLHPRQRIAIFVLDHRSGNTGYVQVAVR